CYFFLNLSKIDISENLRFLAGSFRASCVLTCPVESKPNSRMIKMKTIGVVLMASSIIDKNRRGEEGEQNTNQRTRDGEPEGKIPARVLGDCICLHAIFLKRSSIDISQNMKFFGTHAAQSGRSALTSGR